VIPDSLDLPVGGESRGRRRLHAFVRDELDRYGTGRDDLDANETSRLSPYLRFGCISANEAAARAAAPTSPSTPASAEAFVRQLCWRDFFRQLLASDPAREWKDLRPGPRVASPPSEFALDSWTNGATGIPLVDAGMRQLRREGWIHNRARLVVASFLTRRLGIRWQAGAAHFLHWLVDGDPANNAGGWQWTAGTGTDPRRSRAFNPVRQARRYDPGGRYVRRYVGELADAPPSVIMAPWRDPGFLRSRAYPPPIVDVPDG
jgi:deoxyribodipyrimidine photo-lyase